MEGDAGKGLECQKTMVGRVTDDGNAADVAIIPSCCLKARASDPELEAKCHSTVVSGWFSEPGSCSGNYFNLFSSVYNIICFLKLCFPCSTVLMFGFDYWVDKCGVH